MIYNELLEALTELGLNDRCTLQQIKARHRKLVKRYHPDTGTGNPETIRKINAAYKILLGYVESYRYSFAETEFYEQNPEEQIRRQFTDDPLWGKG